jgi:hypothetical protein
MNRQPVSVTDLDSAGQQRLRLRLEHLMEVETGYRSGSAALAGPGEPRPG